MIFEEDDTQFLSEERLINKQKIQEDYTVSLRSSYHIKINKRINNLLKLWSVFFEVKF